MSYSRNNTNATRNTNSSFGSTFHKGGNTNSSFGSTFHKGGNGGKKPFCKVCFDAKKPQSVYESHWVKDREGKVTCVTLLEQECRYCYQSGHTVKFCPAVAANNAQKEKAENRMRRQQESEERHRRQEQANAAAAAKAKMTARGGYASLNLDDDSDDETPQNHQNHQNKKTQKREEFPALGAPSQRVTTSAMNFASAIQKDPILVEKERIIEERERKLNAGFTVLSKNNDGTVKKEEPKMPSSMPATVEPTYCYSRKIKSWVDTDSEDEDDEDQYFAPNVTVRSKTTVSSRFDEDQYNAEDNSAW